MAILNVLLLRWLIFKKHLVCRSHFYKGRFTVTSWNLLSVKGSVSLPLTHILVLTKAKHPQHTLLSHCCSYQRQMFTWSFLDTPVKECMDTPLVVSSGKVTICHVEVIDVKNTASALFISHRTYKIVTPSFRIPKVKIYSAANANTTMIFKFDSSNANSSFKKNS